MYDKEIEDIQYKVPIKHKTSNNGKIEEQKGIRHIENKIQHVTTGMEEKSYGENDYCQ